MNFLRGMFATALLLGTAVSAEAQYAANRPGYRQTTSGQNHPAAVQTNYVAQPQQAVAMRPTSTSYGAVPTSGFTSLKPINPPSTNGQRVLVAQRNTPTAASAVSQAQPAAAAPAPQQYWNPGMNSQPWNGAPGGVGPQPDPSVGGYGQNPGAPAYDGGAATGGDCGCQGGGCGGCGRCGWTIGSHLGCCKLHSGCCGLKHHCLFCSTGDMPQHMPFFGTTHGYYYFRPYHVMHVFSQQELATRWGGDPRNPYDNSMFQRLYEQMGVDAATQKAREEAAAKSATAAQPPIVQEYIVPGQPVVPTPMPGYADPRYNDPRYSPQYVPGQPAPPGTIPPEAVPPGGPIPNAIPQGAVPQGVIPPGAVAPGVVPSPVPTGAAY